MGMGVCKDCLHRGGYGGAGRKINDLLACRLAESGGGEPDYKKTAAFALDFEGYSATLLTRPDFGCNQFEWGGR